MSVEALKNDDEFLSVLNSAIRDFVLGKPHTRVYVDLMNRKEVSMLLLVALHHEGMNENAAQRIYKAMCDELEKIGEEMKTRGEE